MKGRDAEVNCTARVVLEVVEVKDEGVESARTRKERGWYGEERPNASDIRLHPYVAKAAMRGLYATPSKDCPRHRSCRHKAPDGTRRAAFLGHPAALLPPTTASSSFSTTPSPPTDASPLPSPPEHLNLPGTRKFRPQNARSHGRSSVIVSDDLREDIDGCLSRHVRGSSAQSQGPSARRAPHEVAARANEGAFRGVSAAHDSILRS